MIPATFALERKARYLKRIACLAKDAGKHDQLQQQAQLIRKANQQQSRTAK